MSNTPSNSILPELPSEEEIVLLQNGVGSAHDNSSTDSSGENSNQPIPELNGNGCTPVSDGSENPSDPSIYNDLHARDSLGSRAAETETAADVVTADVESEESLFPGFEVIREDEDVDYSAYEIPGADLSDEVLPFIIRSTPDQVDEAIAFFERAKASETADQAKRARTQSRVFSIMQYRKHPETGEVMLTQEQIDKGFDELGDRIHRSAYIWHPFDRLVEVDEGTGEAFCCGIKADHMHMALWMADRPTNRTISDAFMIPSARIRTPKEVAAQGESQEHAGRNAAEKAFFDLSEYLPHESRSKHAIAGVHQKDRYYLADTTQEGNPGKYQYGRGRVVANFDFSKELDAHMAGRKSAAEGTTSLRSRKLKLRRAVMDGMTLRVAREKDRDAYADDLPRLKQLAKDFEEIQGEIRMAEVGDIWQKTLILATGESRTGKDELLEALAAQLKWLAQLAGLVWVVVKPAGKNTLEDIGLAEIVHHEDMRYQLVPEYDEALRYFDPNQAAGAGTRHKNSAAPTPRVVMGSSSETLLSLAFTLKRRASSDYLAEIQASNSQKATRLPSDVDEFLFRIGWHVEVTKPEDVGDDIEALHENMMVSISRVRDGGVGHRVEPVTTRAGQFMGDIRTRHVLEPVAMIRGCENAARFLAVSIIQERNPDVAKAIPEEQLSELFAGQQSIVDEAHIIKTQLEAEATAKQQVLTNEKAAEAARTAQIHADRLAEHERLLALCTCEGKPCGGWGYHTSEVYIEHADDCPALTDEERQKREALMRKREEERQRDLEQKAQRIRDNGGMFALAGN